MMQKKLTVADFLVYKGRWVAFQVHTRLPRGVDLPWYRAWVWGASPKFVYLADSKALSVVWMVPYRIFAAIRKSFPGYVDPHVNKADWYDAWCRLYEIRDLPKSASSAFVTAENNPIVQDQDKLL